MENVMCSTSGTLGGDRASGYNTSTDDSSVNVYLPIAEDNHLHLKGVKCVELQVKSHGATRANECTSTRGVPANC